MRLTEGDGVVPPVVPISAFRKTVTALTLHSNRVRLIGISYATIFSLQALQQGCNIASGIFLVRMLSKADFAVYSFVLAMSGLGSLLADCGLGQAIMSFTARAKKDGAVEKIYIAATALQNSLFLIVFPVLAIIFLSTVTVLGQSLVVEIILMLATGMIIYSQARMTRVGNVLNGIGAPGALSRAQLYLAIARLGVVLVVALVPSSFGAVGSTVIISILAGSLGASMLRRKAEQAGAFGAQAPLISDCTGERADLRKFVLPLIPSIIYYAFQGNMLVVIAAVIGTANTIADVSALNRIAALFTILATVNSIVVMPQIAKAASARSYLNRCGIVMAICCLSALSLVGVARLFPAALLSILGPQYSGLQVELLLALSATGVGFVTSTLYICIIARGASQYQFVTIPVTLIIQIATLILFHGSSVMTAIVFNLASNLAGLITQIALFIMTARRELKASQNA